MPASIAEEHVDSLGAALSVLLAGLAGSYYLLVFATAARLARELVNRADSVAPQ